MSAEFAFYSHKSEIDGSGGEADNAGWLLQGGYVTAENWGFGVRLSGLTMDPNATTAASNVVSATGIGTAKGDVMEATVGVTRYLNGHDHKVMAELVFQQVDFDAAASTDADNMIFVMRYSLSM